nr:MULTISPECIES: preprotein translocase subunit YajC [unclassified Acinetobacter]
MMPHMTHNYMLGLAVLIFAFIFFYTPMVYAFLAIRKQQKRKQNK